MEALIELLRQYWVFVAGAALLGGPSLVAFVKQKLGSIKLPKLPSFKFGKSKLVSGPANDDLVSKDIEAIQWLANRAVDVNDEQLILELENVNKKFFHIHRDMRKPVSDSAVST